MVKVKTLFVRGIRKILEDLVYPMRHYGVPVLVQEGFAYILSFSEFVF